MDEAAAAGPSLTCLRALSTEVTHDVWMDYSTTAWHTLVAGRAGVCFQDGSAAEGRSVHLGSPEMLVGPSFSFNF